MLLHMLLHAVAIYIYLLVTSARLYFCLNTMDDDDYYLMESLADEGNLDEADQFDLAVVATFILVGVSARQQDWAEHHHLHRLYLLHSHLMPCPQRDTPWQQLYASKSKQAFITTMGVSVKTFQFVLKQGFHMA